ncbi:hypothetical protein [Nostoc sp.]|uniref:hypothetical protein n=1 Tax=Nostoc sp. TaxID=1180 RepID=UPI002FFBA021
MLQPTFSSSVKSSAKIINRVFYLPYPDLVLVPKIVPLFKASILGTNNLDEKTLKVIIPAYLLFLGIVYI